MTMPVLWRPGDKEELLALLATHGDEAMVMAGGTALSLMWKNGLLDFEHLVACTRLPGFDHVRLDDDGTLRLGALARLRDLELSPLVAQHLPLLQETLHLVANLRVRNAATIGGNLAEADYSSDPPCVLTARGARVRLESERGVRWVPLTGLVEYFFETVIEPDEFLTEVAVPIQQRTQGGAYVKFVSRSAEDRTCLGVAAILEQADDGTCAGLELCVSGGTPAPIRLPDVEAQLVGQPLDDARIDDLAASYVEAADPISDGRGSAAFRRQVMRPLIVQAVRRAAAGGNGAELT